MTQRIQILVALDKFLENNNNMFICHLDGNPSNNHIKNLAYVTPREAFRHPDWQVDWVWSLIDDQIKYVRENCDFFKTRFSAPRF